MALPARRLAAQPVARCEHRADRQRGSGSPDGLGALLQRSRTPHAPLRRPQVLCALLDAGRCPLHDEATIAIYDRASITPEFTLRLLRAGRSVPVAFAADRLDAEGRHEPLITSVAPRAGDACV